MISLGQLAKSNAELVEKMVRILGEFSLAPATPDEAREPLGINESDRIEGSSPGRGRRGWACPACRPGACVSNG